MMNKLNSKKWIVAVSGGPDSMALLDLCVKNKVDVVVAHVNYHKRDTADRDESCVRNYCEMHSIPFHVIHPKKTTTGNFQAWARDVRYDFFVQCYLNEKADGLLVGHHQDDLIETYLFQKKRNSIPSIYGIAEKTKQGKMLIQRPLLKMSKRDCMDYCIENHVPYQIDESNLGNDYTRNKIRHNIVEKMSQEERKAILKEIKEKNIEKKKIEKKYSPIIKGKQLNYTLIEHEPKEIRLVCLRLWFKQQKRQEANNTKSFFEQLDHVLISRPNYELELNEGLFTCSNRICEIMGNEDKSYKVVLQSIHDFKTPRFIVKAKGLMGVNACTVKESDFPITIRNVRQGDFIQLRFGTKKINRWFIDRKIPLKDRKNWPVVLNCNDEVILVPGIGCNVEHYSIKPNLFVLKY